MKICPFDQGKLPHKRSSRYFRSSVGIAKKINWPTLETFQNLKVLSACGVFLEKIPFAWENFGSLTELDLSQNFIKDFETLYAIHDTLKN